MSDTTPDPTPEATSEVEREDGGTRRRYVIRRPEGEAELTLSVLSPERVIADHTFVSTCSPAFSSSRWRSGVMRSPRICFARSRVAWASSESEKSIVVESSLAICSGHAETEHGDDVALQLVRAAAVGEDEQAPEGLLQLAPQHVGAVALAPAPVRKTIADTASDAA